MSSSLSTVMGQVEEREREDRGGREGGQFRVIGDL